MTIYGHAILWHGHALMHYFMDWIEQKGRKDAPKTDAFDVKLFVIERFMLVMFVSFS